MRNLGLKFGVWAMLTLGAVVAGATAAFADVSSDPLNGAEADVQSGLQAFIEQHLVPLLVAFLVLGVAAGMLVRWVRKSRSVATP